MPPYPEPTRVHTLLFALNLNMQETILKRRGSFTTRNELQKLAVELEALEVKKDKRRDRNRSDNPSYENRKSEVVRTPLELKRASTDTQLTITAVRRTQVEAQPR